MSRVRVLAACLGLSLFAVSPALATDTTLHDGFKAGTLDGTKWTVLDGGGGISTNYGSPAALRLEGAYGSNNHKRIDSVDSFAAGTYGLARLWLSGNYQKFGFRVNASETGGLEAGAYFDTLEPTYGGAVDTVYAIVRDCTSGVCIVPLKEAISVSWQEWHVFKIVWMPQSVDFYVDGEWKAAYSHELGGSPGKPVGVWNDRTSRMLVDWVFTTPKLVALEYSELGLRPSGCGVPASGTILYDLDGISCMFSNPSAKVTEFSQEAGVLFSSSIHTSSKEMQWIGVFLLNEGANLTFNYNQPEPFEYNSTPPGTSLDFNDAGWGGTFGPTPPASYLDVLGAVKVWNIDLKYPPKKGVANIHLGLHFTRDAGVTTERLGINVHVKP